MMQDKRALQCGTSHDLGQNFAKAFNIQFQDKDGQLKYAWQTSWGVTTRLIGAMIMTHGDDKGVIMPPKIAPIKAVFVPIWKDDSEMEKTVEKCNELAKSLGDMPIKVDSRDNYKPAWKYFEWERKGVPVRIELGPKDLEKGQAVLVRRDTGEKIFISQNQLKEKLEETLKEIQKNLFNRALKFREENTYSISTWSEFKDIIENKGGFVDAVWCGSAECEAKIKEETAATIRVILNPDKKADGECIFCNGAGKVKAIFAKSY
jgi:prolyl-tRNA synthetase